MVTPALAEDFAELDSSRAVALTDAQLDEITAGEASMEKILFNPGNASQTSFHKNNTVLINFPPDTNFDNAAGVIFHTNPGKGTTTHCIGTPICL